mgnify:FL=1
MVSRSRFGGRVGDGFTITMEPGGLKLLRGMEKWADLIEDASEAWPHVTNLIHRHNMRTFKSEGAATGNRRKWAPLSPAYAIQKAREFPGRPILVRTGALRSALTGGSGSRVRKTKKTLTVGAKGEQARIGTYHQLGTAYMPARPPIKFDPRIKPGTLPYVVSQILQTMIVAKRRKALGADAGIIDAKDFERRQGSMKRLARKSTR